MEQEETKDKKCCGTCKHSVPSCFEGSLTCFANVPFWVEQDFGTVSEAEGEDCECWEGK